MSGQWLQVEYHLSNKFRREEFVKTGVMWPETACLGFDPAQLTEEERKILAEQLEFDAVGLRPKLLMFPTYGGTQCSAEIRVNGFIKNVKELVALVRDLRKYYFTEYLKFGTGFAVRELNRLKYEGVNINKIRREEGVE